MLIDPRAGVLFTWAGPVFVVLCSIGMMVGGLFPPTRPTTNAMEVARFFVDHRTGIAIGTILMCSGTGFPGLFISAVAVQMRRTEMGAPLTALFVRVVALTVGTLMACRRQAASACTRPG